MIYVFKTSVKTRLQAKGLKPDLDKFLPSAKWNFDLHDCDKILRIDSDENIVMSIIDVLRKHHYKCEELD